MKKQCLAEIWRRSRGEHSRQGNGMGKGHAGKESGRGGQSPRQGREEAVWGCPVTGGLGGCLGQFCLFLMGLASHAAGMGDESKQGGSPQVGGIW